jgi:hypothetical protein
LYKNAGKFANGYGIFTCGRKGRGIYACGSELPISSPLPMLSPRHAHDLIPRDRRWLLAPSRESSPAVYMQLAVHRPETLECAALDALDMPARGGPWGRWPRPWSPLGVEVGSVLGPFRLSQFFSEKGPTSYGPTSYILNAKTRLTH